MKSKEIFPPSRALLASVEAVCKQTNPYKILESAEISFSRAMKEIMLWHQEKSPFYRQFLKDHQFESHNWSGDFADIPSIPAEFF